MQPRTVGLVAKAVTNIGAFSVVINVLLLVVPLYLLQVYDRVLPASSIETLIYLSIIAGACLVFLGALEIARSIYAQRVAMTLDKQLASTAFMASVADPNAESGETRELRDLATVRGFLESRALPAFFDLPFAPLFVLLLYFIHPLLFWLTSAGIAVLLLLLLLSQNAGRKNATAGREEAGIANLMAQSYARSGETIRAMGMSSNLAQTWGATFASSRHNQARLAAINAVSSGVSRALRMSLQLAILGTGAWLVLQGEMTAGMIFAASIISSRGLQPIDQLIGSWRAVVEAKSAWQRLKQLDRTQPRKLELPAPEGGVAAKDLLYSAPGAGAETDPIIKRISFAIEPGEMVALIGPNGAGKTTLARLLVGAIAPTGGSITIDGSELGTWEPEQLGRHVGYLAQDVHLLSGTIAQNVSRFDQNATDQSIVEAAQCAQAHDMIRAQREGYQTRVGTTGLALSGGVRQRIALARAFYGNPRILVLDEPNANLDSAGEVALQSALLSARSEKRSIILVTHRLGMAALCDRVMLMDRGLIKAFGPPDSILQRVQPSNAAVTLNAAGSARFAKHLQATSDPATIATAAE